MKKLFTLFAVMSLFTSFSQFTTVYETGNGTSDGWTGWSSTTTNVGAENVNGVNFYIFTLSGGMGANYSIEISRAFNITGTPINVSYTVFAQSSTLELLYSEDNVNWTSIDSDTYGTTYSSSAYAKSVTPTVSNYYLMLRLTGTVGDQSQANFSNLSIEESDNGTIGLANQNIDKAIIYYNNTLNVQFNGSYSVRLFNSAGSLVMNEENLISSDLNNLNPGLYFVQLQDSKGNSTTKKIIVR